MNYAQAFLSSFLATMREILPWCLSLMALSWGMMTLGRWSSGEDWMILVFLGAFGIMAVALCYLGVSGGDRR